MLSYIVTHAVKKIMAARHIIVHLVGRPFSSELFIHICQTALCHIPEAHRPNQHFCCYVDITEFKKFISHFLKHRR